MSHMYSCSLYLSCTFNWVPPDSTSSSLDQWTLIVGVGFITRYNNVSAIDGKLKVGAKKTKHFADADELISYLDKLFKHEDINYSTYQALAGAALLAKHQNYSNQFECKVGENCKHEIMLVTV